VLEVLRGKFPFDKLKDKIIDMKQRYGTAHLVIEESPISHGLIQSLREKHINVVDIKPDRDKRSRLISQIDLFEGGSVLLPKDAPWLDAFDADAKERDDLGAGWSGHHRGLMMVNRTYILSFKTGHNLHTWVSRLTRSDIGPRQRLYLMM